MGEAWDLDENREKNMMRSSETVAEVSLALVDANAKLEHALKDSSNPHFRSRFASLNSVLETIKPVYAAHRLTVVQMPGMDDLGRATVTSRIVHESGEWIEHTAAAPLQKDDPQGVGSAITYLRRYSLAALSGIGQEDDDGNAASSDQSVSDEGVICPKCAKVMWDNRKSKTGKQPDFKCKDKSCDHAIWFGRWPDQLIADAQEALEAGVIDESKKERIEAVALDGDPIVMGKTHHWLLKKLPPELAEGA